MVNSYLSTKFDVNPSDSFCENALCGWTTTDVCAMTLALLTVKQS